MKIKLRQVLIANMFIILFSIIAPLNTEASLFNFSVIPRIPKNQISEGKSDFDLVLKEGEEETLKVDLINTSDEDITITTDINSATTNINGVVDYEAKNINIDDSLIYNLKDYTRLSKEVEIPKKDRMTLEIDVTSPTESFDGVMAGVIIFKEKQKFEDEESEDSVSSIKNQFSYVIPLVVRQNQTEVLPNINLLKIATDKINTENVLDATFQNNQATFINQVKISTVIKKYGKMDAIYETTRSGLQLAPNSQFDFPIALDSEKIEAGKYTMTTLIWGGETVDGKYKDEKGKTYNYRWVIDKDFEVTKEEAEALNSKGGNSKLSYIIWYGLSAVLLLILLISILLLRKSKNKI